MGKDNKTDNKTDNVEVIADNKDELVVDPEIMEEGGTFPNDAEESEGIRNARIEELENEIKVAKERYLRLIADTDNFRKRMIKEREENEKRANEKLIKNILPILDNLQRALEVSDNTADVPKDFLDGIKMVEQDFIRVLSESGVKPIDPLPGTNFDPTIHEALHRVETDEQPSGTVVRYLQNGYLYNDRLLRPALVLVATEPEKTIPGFVIDPKDLIKETETETETDSESDPE